MKLIFTPEDLENKINIIEFPDLIFTCKEIEKGQDTFIMTGTALVEEEIYHNFKVEFSYNEPYNSMKELLNGEWDFYDYI